MTSADGRERRSDGDDKGKKVWQLSHWNSGSGFWISSQKCQRTKDSKPFHTLKNFVFWCCRPHQVSFLPPLIANFVSQMNLQRRVLPQKDCLNQHFSPFVSAAALKGIRIFMSSKISFYNWKTAWEKVSLTFNLSDRAAKPRVQPLPVKITCFESIIYHFYTSGCSFSAFTMAAFLLCCCLQI